MQALAVLLLIGSANAGVREEEQFILPNYNQLRPSFQFPSVQFPPMMEDMLSDLGGWFPRAPFSPFPSMFDFNPDIWIKSFMPNLSSLIPQISLSDDCVVTVTLGDMNINDTDIKVYTSERDIELHVSTVNIREWRAPSDSDVQDSEDDDSTLSPTPRGPDGTDNALSRENALTGGSFSEASKMKRLRGFGEMSSSTTIRKIPAPPQCDILNEEARATVDTASNSLLIKFPLKPGAVVPTPGMNGAANEVVANGNGVAQANGLSGGSRMNQDGANVAPGLPDQGADGRGPAADVGAGADKMLQNVDLSSLMNQSPEAEKKSWWFGLFNQKEQKRTVPIVNREEF